MSYEIIQPRLEAQPEQVTVVEDDTEAVYTDLSAVKKRSGPNVLVYEERTVRTLNGGEV